MSYGDETQFFIERTGDEDHTMTESMKKILDILWDLQKNSFCGKIVLVVGYQNGGIRTLTKSLEEVVVK